MTHELHPDIRKFWEDEGFDIEPGLGIAGLNGEMYWVAKRSGYLPTVVATTKPNSASTYIFFGLVGEYTEEEALRIVKLKAFL